MAAVIKSSGGPQKPRLLDASGNSNHATLYTGRAMSFDGSNDVVVLPATEAFMSGNKPRTTMSWVYLNNETHSFWYFFGDTYGGGQSWGPRSYGAGDNLGLMLNSSAGNADWNTGIPTTRILNRWAHVAWTYDGYTLAVYIDGVLEATQTGYNVNTDGLWKGSIGARNTNSSGTAQDQHTSEYVSDLRVYSTALSAQDIKYVFDNPENQPWDNLNRTSFESISNVDVLIPLDNGSILEDKSSNSFSISLHGNALMSTENSPFNSHCLKFDGSTGTYAKLADSEVFNEGSSDYTIECWAYIAGYNDSGTDETQGIWHQGEVHTTHRSTNGLEYRPSTESVRWLIRSPDGSFDVDFNSGTGSVQMNKWYHFACVREGNTHKIIVNGRQLGTNTADTGSMGNLQYPLYLGQRDTYTDDKWPLNGYIAGFRWTDIALSTKEFVGNKLPVRSHNLKGHWPLTDGRDGALVNDISGNNNHGINLNNSAGTVTVNKYIPQISLQDFNNYMWDEGTGVCRMIEFGDVLPTNTSIATVSAWFIMGDEVNNNCLFGFGTEPSNTNDLYWWHAEDAFGVNNWNGNNWGIDNAAALIRDNKWHHVVVEFHSNATESSKMWIDGIAQTMGNHTGTNINRPLSSNFSIGNNGWWTGANQQLDGAITEVSVFNSAISDDQVSELFNNGTPLDALMCGLSNNLKGYWRNKGNSEWTDLSGNNNHGAHTTNGTEFLVPRSDSNIGTYKPDDKTTLLMHCEDNTDDSYMKSSFTQVNTVTTSSDSVFGNSSLDFTSGGYNTDNKLTTPNTDGRFTFTDDFTIDFWYKKISSTGQYESILNNWSATGDWRVLVNDVSGQGMKFILNSGSQVYNTNKVIVIGEWHHYACTRRDGVVRVFYDGQLCTTNTLGGTLTPATGDLVIGGTQDGMYRNPNGYLDELRIINGRAEWVDNFTPRRKNSDKRDGLGFKVARERTGSNQLLNLSGDSGCGILPNISAGGSDSFTAGCWVKNEDWVGLSHPMIMTNDINIYWILWCNTDNVNPGRFSVRLGGSTTLEHTSQPVNGQWYHVMFTHDATNNTNRLYIDGQLSKTATAAISPGGLNISLGSADDERNRSNGEMTIDQALVYQHKLETSEILDLYNEYKVNYGH